MSPSLYDKLPLQLLKGTLLSWHFEVVQAERFDLTEKSRMTTRICLN